MNSESIVRLGQSEILHLAENLTAADLRGASVRVMTGTDNEGRTFIKWDAGSGWTPPYYGLDW
jgi:hypothetical protein